MIACDVSVEPQQCDIDDVGFQTIEFEKELNDMNR